MVCASQRGSHRKAAIADCEVVGTVILRENPWAFKLRMVTCVGSYRDAWRPAQQAEWKWFSPRDVVSALSKFAVIVWIDRTGIFLEIPSHALPIRIHSQAAGRLSLRFHAFS